MYIRYMDRFIFEFPYSFWKSTIHDEKKKKIIPVAIILLYDNKIIILDRLGVYLFLMSW
jgi:hypothetical protein